MVEQSHEIGVNVDGPEATIESSVVRGTESDALGLAGRGINLQADPATGLAARLVLRASRVEHNREIGVSISGSEATIEASIVGPTTVNGEGRFGRGVSVHADPTTHAPTALTITSTAIVDSHEAGLAVVDSAAAIDACFVSGTVPNEAGSGGDGILVFGGQDASGATLTASRIDRSDRAAVATFGGHVVLSGAALTCQAFDLDAETYQG